MSSPSPEAFKSRLDDSDFFTWYLTTAKEREAQNGVGLWLRGSPCRVGSGQSAAATAAAQMSVHVAHLCHGILCSCEKRGATYALGQNPYEDTSGDKSGVENTV